MPLNLVFTQAGTFTIDDNGIPGDNISVIRDSNGVVIFTFAHPADALGLTVNVPGVNLIINFTDSLGAADFTIGSLTNAAITPDSVVMQNVQTTGDVTIVSNTSIVEGSDADAAPDIVSGTLIMSAVSGIGAPGAAIETQTSFMEAETVTGGLTITNFGSVQIGGITDFVNGLDVLTSGDLNFAAIGSIFLSDIDLDAGTNPPNPPAQTIHGGDVSGNVSLTANGFLTDIITNTDTDAISAPRGNISLTAGRDIAFGTIGVDFDNDVRANGSVTINAGRDFLLDGFSDLSSDDFFNNTGGSVVINTGRNVHLRNIAGSDATVTASGTAGADVIITTGFGGALILDAPSTTALNSSSGDVIVNADRMLINASSGITANSGTVTLNPATSGRGVILGSASDAAFAVELSDAELDRVFTGDLIIGGNNAGQVRVIAPVSFAALDLFIRSGANISVESSFSTNVLGSITLSALGSIFQLAATTITTGAFQAFVDAVDTDPGIGGVAAFSGNVSVTSSVINGNLDADTLSGNGAANLILGFGGNDTLRGFGGGDTLDGGTGADAMFGGLGDDNFVVDNAGDTVNESVGEGNDTVSAGVSYTLTAGAEIELLTTGFIVGTAAIDFTGNELANQIWGNNGANSINGGGGVDVLLGFGGNDTINGGTGADTMVGGTGNDTYFVDNVGDSIGEAAGEGFDIVAAGVDYTLAAGTEIELMTTGFIAGTAPINFGGNDLANQIWGNNGANSINGGGGNDALFGFGGNDTLNGGVGADLLVGGDGVDTFAFTTALGAANVDAVNDMVAGIDKIALDDAIFTGLPLGPLAAGAFRSGASAADADDRIIYNPATGALIFDADGNGGGVGVQFATLATGLSLAATDFTVI
jgi:Ca2+-binding RTX toxin-like protein